MTAWRELRDVLLAAAPAEPAGLRIAMHDRAVEDPGGAAATIAWALGEVLWTAWHEALSHNAVAPNGLAGVLRGARRECWLWAMGERGWAPTVEGLAGRTARAACGGSAGEASHR